MAIANSTIAANRAAGSGGGILAPQPFANPTVDVTSTIIAYNAGKVGREVSGTITASYDLIQGLSGYVLAQSVQNIIGKDPLLGALAQNGGPTETMLIPPQSPAVDAAANLIGALVDQRGRTRVLGNGADIGAVEVG